MLSSLARRLDSGVGSWDACCGPKSIFDCDSINLSLC